MPINILKLFVEISMETLILSYVLRQKQKFVGLENYR